MKIHRRGPGLNLQPWGRRASSLDFNGSDTEYLPKTDEYDSGSNTVLSICNEEDEEIEQKRRCTYVMLLVASQGYGGGRAGASSFAAPGKESVRVQWLLLSSRLADP
ncbi:hypothetical protein TNCV_994791 [Trichonephila clavipes]|nr:hypothetical protein TNCV_994791 [Trichonephila clavipes]